MGRKSLLAPWLLLAWLPWAAACGGSGSSGLDIVAAENDAIDWAMQEMACVQDAIFEKPYCPMGVPVEPPTPGQPTPSVDPTKTVQVALANGETLDCVRTGPRLCEIEVEFSAVGFEEDGDQFYVAATATPRDGDWQVSMEPAMPTDEPMRYVATVEVELPEESQAEELSVQVAVLTVPESASPPAADPEALSVTDADAVYVDEERPLVPDGEPPVEPTPTPTPEPSPTEIEATPAPTPDATPTGDSSPAPSPSGLPGPSGSPGAAPTPDPIESPVPTIDPGPTFTPVPQPTEHPQVTPGPTEAPVETPAASPEPTEDPGPTPEPTDEPEPTGGVPTPEPSDQPTPALTPTADPGETPTPDPEPTPTPDETATPPAATPAETATPVLTPEPSPLATLEPVEGLDPVRRRPPISAASGGRA